MALPSRWEETIEAMQKSTEETLPMTVIFTQEERELFHAPMFQGGHNLNEAILGRDHAYCLHRLDKLSIAKQKIEEMERAYKYGVYYHNRKQQELSRQDNMLKSMLIEK